MNEPMTNENKLNEQSLEQHFALRTPVLETLGVSSLDFAKLKNYLFLLAKANEELNLVSRKMTAQELIDNHLIDCLLPLTFLKQLLNNKMETLPVQTIQKIHIQFPLKIKNIADFGSGGGLPAIVYAICCPEVQFHLFEKSPKKQDFLKSCRAIVPNITVHGDIPLDLSPLKIDLVTSRAFKPIDVILEMSRRYYQNQGAYFLLKGRAEKIQEEQRDALKKFKSYQSQIIPLSSPLLDVERHLVMI